MTDVDGLWAGFPVEVQPRPLVLVGDPLLIADSGFTDDASKHAWHSGAITSTVELPEGLADRLPPQKMEPGAGSLTISSVTPTRSQFRSDRGPRQLPAYRLVVSGLREPCVLLDPAVTTWWPSPINGLPLPFASAGQARLDADGITVRLPAFGNVLTEFVRAELTEHRTHVVGRAITTQRPARGPIIGRGVPGVVIGQLSRPLGSRVLVDERGFPFIVNVSNQSK